MKIKMLVLIWMSCLLNGFAQQEGAQRLDRSMKKEIMDWACKNLNEGYIYPDTAKKIEIYVRKKFKQGGYESDQDILTFTRALTNDLREVTGDGHCWIRYNPNLPPPDSSSAEEKEQRRQKDIEAERRTNFHFHKVERLDGNVGYIRFDEFDDALYAGPTAVAALNFLANCDALLIDLRQNHGGNGTMVQLLLSAFFDEPVQYSSTYSREGDRTEHHWTLSFIGCPKLSHMDLYVLTSERTFSAAEAFTQALKKLNRATVIGELTGGGSHMIGFCYHRNFSLEQSMPKTRPLEDDWGGYGIEPHVKTTQDEAFDVAYDLALERMAERIPDGQKEDLQWILEYRKGTRQPIPVHEEILKSYAGQYGPIRIEFKDGALFLYEPGEAKPKRMVALSETLFVLEGNPDIRVRFESDENEMVSALIGIWKTGRIQRLPKS